MAAQSNVVVVDKVLAVAKPSAYALLTLVLCVLIAMAEGYDVQAMALAAPLVAREWGLAPDRIGLLLSISFVGTFVGSIILAPLGDVWGRRPCAILGLFIAGAGTAAGMITPDFPSLLAARFVSGFGLGLSLPIVLTVVMEILSNRFRVVAVVVISCGYPLGAGIGGRIVAHLLPDRGYPAAFLVGGLMTAAVLVLSIIWLPESPLYLARKKRDVSRLAKLLERLGAQFPSGATSFVLTEVPVQKSRIGALFADNRARVTWLLWLLMFANMAMVMFMTSWLPSLLTYRGQMPDVAIRSTSIFYASGVLGGVLLAILVYWFKPTWVLASSYVVAILSILGLTVLGSSGHYLLVIAVAGAMILGTQFCVNAVVNQYYPSSMRATAAGFANAAGRAGGVVAPLAGGIAMAHASSMQQGFMVVIVPAVAALLAVLALQGPATIAQRDRRNVEQDAIQPDGIAYVSAPSDKV